MSLAITNTAGMIPFITGRMKMQGIIEKPKGVRSPFVKGLTPFTCGLGYTALGSFQLVTGIRRASRFALNPSVTASNLVIALGAVLGA